MKARLCVVCVGVVMFAGSVVHAEDGGKQPIAGDPGSTATAVPKTAMFESNKATEKLREAFVVAIERVQEIPQCGGLFVELEADGAEMLSTTIYMPTHPFDEQSLCQTAAASSNGPGRPPMAANQRSE